jgi:UDP-N-acetylglucosamine--N-acetylmuramyl-(pentapeptide) pyrophosphoryl-undecaprenol N-acetylglucosamine transferase
VVVSYDLRPGLASKLAARRATAVAAAFPDSPLPRAHLTGAPIRPEIIAVDRRRDRDAARHALGLPLDRFVVTVFGGSLGAKAINEAVAGMVAAWSDRSDVYVHHVVGDRWLADAPPPRPGPAGIMYDVIGYEDRMPQLYAAGDLMSRAPVRAPSPSWPPPAPPPWWCRGPAPPRTTRSTTHAR